MYSVPVEGFDIHRQFTMLEIRKDLFHYWNIQCLDTVNFACIIINVFLTPLGKQKRAEPNIEEVVQRQSGRYTFVLLFFSDPSSLTDMSH